MITARMMLAAGATPGAAAMWLPALNAAAVEWRINSVARQGPWLANMAHECAGFSRMTESFNYSAERLLEVWPCTPQRMWGFTPEEAKSYARKPEEIANRVYAKRYGNGPSSSGDGWRYRGRGPFNLTFKANYAEMGPPLGYALVANPDLALGIVAGARIAARFWTTRGCNELADVADDEGIRRAIQGGTRGLEDVVRRLEAIEEALE